MIALVAAVYAAEPVIDATRLLTLSTAEVVGMGGAGIGFATGASGTFFQPGAAANRKFESRSALGASLVFNRLGLGPGALVDLGNLGYAGRWAGGMTDLGAAAVWRNAGVGLVFGSLAYAGPDGEVAVSEGHFGGGGAFWDGRVMVGAGYRLLSFSATAQGQEAAYTGVGVETGIALNRLWEGWNLGVVVRTPVDATRVRGDLDLAVDGVAVPWQIGVGAGFYDPRPYTPRPVRMAADLVIDGPVAGGRSLESALIGVPRSRGAEVSVTPRLGVEATVWPERLRWRAGSYLEPARTAGSNPRFHGTTGLEVRVFHFDIFGLASGDVSWELAVDVAPRYLNFAWLGIGFWQRGVTGVGWERPVRASDPVPPSTPTPEPPAEAAP